MTTLPDKPDVNWQPIETLVDTHFEHFDEMHSEVILLWNPCDGLNQEWIKHPLEIVAMGCYTHWAREPKRPTP